MDDEKTSKSALLEKISSLEKSATKRKSTHTKQGELIPLKHQPDFFVANLVDVSFKGDMASMDAPLFSLSLKKDLEIFKWTSVDGSRSIEIAPSAFGRATMFDKDVLLFIASQMTDAINHKKPVSRTVRFTAHEFLVATNRDTSKNGYKSMNEALTRLRGTTIRTNIATGGKQINQTFGLIDSSTVVTSDTGRMVQIEVVLSEWYWNAINNHEVLTLSEDYFRLSKPLERRLYEIARKHVGRQGTFRIALDKLWQKTGSKSELKKFKFQLKELQETGTIPDYGYTLLEGDIVEFYEKNSLTRAKKAKINIEIET
ncbi:replication initiator protein A [Leeia sp. TBRC 13508]|uniref:Replication initiator protein A n=1 Tax=Leeia speluncae TaxID=2884804 RepID=A0ABS8DAE0_9NEIS|nr:replication initiator protein A [Leeia speluncae]MCB6185134.1 replication initiator protein A [Leeia speluncae]